jgi:hypothetical protein
MTASPLNDEALLAAFENATLPASVFSHREHVRVARLFVLRDGLPRALETFSDALRRFAEANGAPALFHTTITWAFLLLIHDRERRAPSADWPAFAATHADLLRWKPSVLDDYYTPETLAR